MVNLCVRVPSVLLKFLLTFRDVFSAPLFRTFSFYVASLMFERKRTNVQTVWADVPVRSYDQFHYLISRAGWDPEEVGRRRVEKLQADHRTRSTPNGILALDDTANPKSNTCHATEGVSKQYCSSLHAVRPAHTVVFSAYVDESKHWPVSFKPYRPAQMFPLGKKDPQFKSKPTLACELMDDAVAQGVQFSDVLFDNWYFNRQVVRHAETLHRSWISEAAVDTIFYYKGKRIRADELVKLVTPQAYTEAITLVDPSKKERRLSLAVLDIEVRMLNAKHRIVIAKGPFLRDDPDEWHIYVASRRELSGPEIVCRWALRWGIEEVFRELKDTLGFDQYQVRSIKATTRHWELACVAHAFLLYARQLGIFQKETSDPIRTLGDVAFIFRTLVGLDSRDWIYEHRDEFKAHMNDVYKARNPRRPKVRRERQVA